MDHIAPDYCSSLGRPSILRDKETGLYTIVRRYKANPQLLQSQANANTPQLGDIELPYGEKDPEYDTDKGAQFNAYLVRQGLTGENTDDGDVILERAYLQLENDGILTEIGTPDVVTGRDGKLQLRRSFIVKNPYIADKSRVSVESYTYNSTSYTLLSEQVTGENVFSYVLKIYGEQTDAADGVTKRSDCSYVYRTTKTGPVGTLAYLDRDISLWSGVFPSFPPDHPLGNLTWYLTDVDRREGEGDSETISYVFTAPPALVSQTATVWCGAASKAVGGRYQFATFTITTINYTAPGVLHIDSDTAKLLTTPPETRRVKLIRYFRYTSNSAINDRTSEPFDPQAGAHLTATYVDTDGAEVNETRPYPSYLVYNAGGSQSWVSTVAKIGFGTGISSTELKITSAAGWSDKIHPRRSILYDFQEDDYLCGWVLGDTALELRRVYRQVYSVVNDLLWRDQRPWQT